MDRLGGIWLLLAAMIAAQTIMPSNNSADLTDPSTSPRFYMNATGSVQFPGFLIAPLGEYAFISRNAFLGIDFSGRIVNTDASNANQVQSHDFNFVPCDPEEYTGGNLDVNAVLRIITDQQADSFGQKSSLIFYSTRSNHCNASNIMTLPDINGIFTTVDPVVAAQIANRNFTENSNAIATLSPDPTYYTSTNGPNSQNSGSANPPTTAVAMIILYSITGIITGLFVIIIITGAVRAHRHPERYGPRNSPGHGRQTRAMGIARAVLETLPIVKFGDHQDLPKPKEQPQGDIEMTGGDSAESSKSSPSGDKSLVTTTTAAVDTPLTPVTAQPQESTDKVSNADGSDEVGSLGCSICTEDFQKGEEVRVLPCNHKFHPDCVDPWLLNVSGTCPLCRINLTQREQEVTGDSSMAPPLASASPFGDRRSQAIHNLMAIAYGSREERITALRQYRTERRDRNASQVNEEERTSRARRFREALRIRTRRHEPTETERDMRDSGVDAISGGQMRP